MFNSIFSLLTSSSGSLVFHLVVSFTYLGTAYLAFSILGLQPKNGRQRLLAGMGLLLFLQIIQFIAAGLGSQGFGQLNLILPVMELIVNTLSVIIYIWLFAFPSQNRNIDVSTLMVGVAIALAGFLSLVYWNLQGTVGTLSNTPVAIVWAILTILFLMGGISLLYTQRSPGWGYGIGLLLILLLAEITQLATGSATEDYSAIMRLAFLAGLPLLFTLPVSQIRATIDDLMSVPLQADVPKDTQLKSEQAIEANAEKQEEPTQVEPIRGVDSKMFQAILALAAVVEPGEICKLLTLHISHAMVADLCLLLSPPDSSGQIILMCGYDLIREESIGGTSFSQNIVPGLVDAIRRDRPLQIPAGDNKLDGLNKVLHMKEIGHFLAMPIISEEEETTAVIVLLSPYSKHLWTGEDQAYLREALPLINELLEKATKEQKSILSFDDAKGELQTLREENDLLQAAMEKLQAETSEPRIVANQQVVELMAAQEAARQAIASLEIENNDLIEALQKVQAEQSGTSEPEDQDQLKGELRFALEQVSLLQNELDFAQSRLNDLEQRNEGGLPPEQIEVIASIAQDLRQPMSSIIGYTDLILSESVGILGALQRKFLDRIRVSTDRMNKLVDDLIQITMMEQDGVHLSKESVDLVPIIDQIINQTSTQLREKEITLRMDIAKDLPRLHADKDALQQILTHLLHNAGAASPVEGAISLRAALDQENGHSYVRLEVSDSGEGIPEEEIPRVFSRLYRADNALISGVGDTGVGLSIVKTLTEALGGRIWVESKRGKGSTFMILLPLSEEAEREESIS